VGSRTSRVARALLSHQHRERLGRLPRLFHSHAPAAAHIGVVVGLGARFCFKVKIMGRSERFESITRFRIAFLGVTRSVVFLKCIFSLGDRRGNPTGLFAFNSSFLQLAAFKQVLHCYGRSQGVVKTSNAERVTALLPSVKAAALKQAFQKTARPI